MTHQEEGTCELVGKEKKRLEEEGKDEKRGIGSPPCVDGGGESSLLLPQTSISQHGEEEKQSEATAAVAGMEEMKEKDDLTSGVGGAPARRQWWGECRPHVVLLREALLSSAPDIAVLGPLHACFSFYMTHLHNEVLSSSYARTMTFGANVTRLESAFMWLGGWRPTSALVLVYSLMGIEIEDALEAARLGMGIVKRSNTSLLSARQLTVMHTLQKHTQHAEMKISKKVTVLQMLTGDQDMLEAVLLDAASALENDSSRFDRAVEKKISRFRRLLVQAEELRLHTLKDLLSILTPIQAARCCVSIFEACFSMRTMGLRLSGIIPVLPIPVALSSLSARLGAPSSTSVPRSPATLPSLSAFVDPSMVPVPVAVPALSAFAQTSSIAPVLPIPVVLPTLSRLVNTSSSALSGVSETPCSLNSPDNILLRPSDEHSVPSWSPSSQLLPLTSQHSEIELRTNTSLSSLLPTQSLQLDQTYERVCRNEEKASLTAVGPHPEEEIITNRLLILSPSTSDVTIQTCSSESSMLEPYFETQAHLHTTIESCSVGTSYQGEAAGSFKGHGSHGHHFNQMSSESECAEQVS